MVNVKNVNYDMEVESVHIVFLNYVRDTCLKRGTSWSWSAMQEDKKHIEENTVTYLVKANNRYEKEVTFKILSITDKLTDVNNIRKTYKEVVMEDIDGEFGKLIINTSEVRANSSQANKSLKNKMTLEYRKTLLKRENDTKEFREQNRKLNKDLDDAKKIDLLHQQQATRKYTELNEKYIESERKNEVLVVDNDKLNKQVVALEKKAARMSKVSLDELSLSDWKRLIKIICKGVVTGKTTEQIKEKVFEFLNECSKDEE